MKTYEVTNIDYDTGKTKILLPKTLTIDIPNDIEEQEEIIQYISDEISNITGWCHLGFNTKEKQT